MAAKKKKAPAASRPSASKKSTSKAAGSASAKTSKKAPTKATPKPASKATPKPTPKPASKAAPKPTVKAAPTAASTAAPKAPPEATTKDVAAAAPKAVPTSAPKAVPTSAPKAVPTSAPKAIPTSVPKAVPTSAPKAVPTSAPKAIPTSVPKAAPPVAAAVMLEKPSAPPAPKLVDKTAPAAAPVAATRPPVVEPPASRAPSAPRAAPARPAAPARIVWHDLMSIDIDKARPFYAALLPWRTKVVALPPLGTTHRIETGGRELGSYVTLPTSEGIPSHWMPYVAVDDLDAVVRRARELGGFVPVAPTTLTGMGRFAVIACPRGAHISPIELSTPLSPAAEPQAGLPAWNEVLTDDPENTARFFAAVFGWKARTQDLGALGSATLFATGDGDKDMVAGCRRAPEGVAPQWVVAWTIAHVDQSVARARQHGAQVITPPTTVPGMGRVAMLKDPTGAHVSLFQPGA